MKTQLSLLLACALSSLPAIAQKNIVSSNRVEELKIRGVGFEFVRIEAGEFRMGSDRGVNEGCRETPNHKVTIARAYLIGRTEVTVGQFRLFVEETCYVTDAEKRGAAWGRTPQGDWRKGLSWHNPEFPQSDDCPAYCVSWHDAQSFCRWFTEVSGKKCRLPSEAEWEYAARCGVKGQSYIADWESGWHLFNSGVVTHPVKSKKPNAWGLYDMNGNVWEWCEDLYHEDYVGAPSDGSAWLTGDGRAAAYPDRLRTGFPFRMMRGGAYNRPPAVMSNTCRQASPEDSASNIGFRLVFEPSEQ